MRRAILAVALLLIAPATAQTTGYDWPQHADVMAAIDAVDGHPWFNVHDLGESVQGKALRLLEITDPDSTVPMDERVVTLLLTQQHGNEPAGTPAALDIIEEIKTGGPTTGLLDDQILLLWPMVNPDGGAVPARANDNGTDLNRDHVALEEPETKALHDVLLRWDVHVAIDHHEYSGTGIGYPSPVNLYDFDVTTLFPRHGNVREPTLAAAQDLMYDGVWPALEEAGYTVNEYGEQTAAGVPVTHVAGGPDPGILRNNFGLQNVAGLLAESFIPLAPNPFVSAERRIDVHRTVMDGALQYAHENADALRAAKSDSERLNLEEPLLEYVEEWPDDPSTGEPDEGNIRADLGEAYRTDTDLDALMALHGLPVGVPDDGGHVYTLGDERAGLIAAIVHPESSRTQAPDAVAVAAPTSVDTGGADGPADKDTPATGMLVIVASLGAAMILRRT